MNVALEIFYYVFNKGISFVFNDMEIATNITIGWICISVIVFSILLGSILNVPHRIGNFSTYEGQTITSETDVVEKRPYYYKTVTTKRRSLKK